MMRVDDRVPRSHNDNQAVSYSLTFLQSAGACALRPCCAAPEEAALCCRLLAKICPALRTRYRVRRWRLEGRPCPRLWRGRLRHCWPRRWCWHCWRADVWKVRGPRRWRLEGRLRGAPSSLGLGGRLHCGCKCPAARLGRWAPPRRYHLRHQDVCPPEKSSSQRGPTLLKPSTVLQQPSSAPLPPKGTTEVEEVAPGCQRSEQDA